MLIRSLFLSVLAAGTILVSSVAFATTQTFTSSSTTCPASGFYTASSALTYCPGFLSGGLSALVQTTLTTPGNCYISATCTGTLSSSSGSTTTNVSPSKSGMAPPINKVVKFPGPATDSTAVVNFNFSTLPVCPKDTSGYPSNPDTTTQVTTNLQDINANMTSTSIPPPPAQCTVKSLVLCGASSCTSTSQTITKSVAAVCPDGYAQVASFDMQPEVMYAPATTYYPLTTIQDYQKYSSTQGFVCTGVTTNTAGTSPQQNNACAQASNVEGSAGSTSDPGWNPWSYNFGISSYQMLQGTINGISGSYVGYLVNNTDFSTCYYSSPANCANYVPGSGCPWPNNIYMRKWKIDKVFISCTRPAGTYFTANMAPRGLVCVRIKPDYNKINK